MLFRSLTVMGIIRELLGNGSFFDIKLWDFTIGFFSNSAGAFFVYGICIALFVFITDAVDKNIRAKRAQALRVPTGDEPLDPVDDPTAKEEA